MYLKYALLISIWRFKKLLKSPDDAALPLPCSGLQKKIISQRSTVHLRYKGRAGRLHYANNLKQAGNLFTFMANFCKLCSYRDMTIHQCSRILHK